MKKFLFILGLGISAATAVNAQEFMDANHQVIAYVNPQKGMFMDKNKNAIATIESDGSLTGPTGKILGYIKDGYLIQDKNHTTIGMYGDKGIVQRPDHSILGRINTGTSQGPVLDNLNNVIGYSKGTEPLWAAAYFFLLNKS